MPSGFYITKLALKGKNTANAEITLFKGLNVISGPSDTGKSFIVKCIDYMFGATDSPNQIPESKKYDTVSLEITMHDDTKKYVFDRGFGSGEIKLYEDGKFSRTLKAKHDKDNEDTLSSFLLKILGLDGKKVRKNSKGEVRLLSFRDLAKLILVNETKIIDSSPPFQRGQIILKTAETSVFRLLLTGKDDSDVPLVEAVEIEKIKKETKSVVIDEIIGNIQHKINELAIKGSSSSLKRELDQNEILYKEAFEELIKEQDTLTLLNDNRCMLWKAVHKNESQINVLSELHKRFKLLQKQYDSDLRRLEAIKEAALCLGQMKEECCPVCGASYEHHNIKHPNPRTPPEMITNACDAESKKIQPLVSDLGETLENTSNKLKLLLECKSIDIEEIKKIDSNIQEHKKTRLYKALQSLREKQDLCSKYKEATYLYEQIEEYEKIKRINENLTLIQKKYIGSPIGESEITNFTAEIERVLASWKFPNLAQVSLNKDYDIVISNQPRASHGKGVRAVIHAAFTVALLRYCAEFTRPHPGLVIIDSPLVVYRQPDAEEKDFSQCLKEAFYHDLANNYKQEQIVIFENEPPPEDIENYSNIIKFTKKEGFGRYGFLQQ